MAQKNDEEHIVNIIQYYRKYRFILLSSMRIFSLNTLFLVEIYLSLPLMQQQQQQHTICF